MTTLIALSLLFAFTFAFWRRQHNKHAELVFRTKIYQLRDQLRQLAIERNIDSKDWVFEHYDRSFSLTINKSYYLTFFLLIVLGVKHSDDELIGEYLEKLKETRENNEYLTKLNDEYVEALKDYLIDQHRVTYNLFKPIFKAIGVFSGIAKKIRTNIESTLVYPETSATPTIRTR